MEILPKPDSSGINGFFCYNKRGHSIFLEERSIFMQLTTKEFAEHEGMEYAQAAGALAFLSLKGIVKAAGKRVTSVTGKGKRSTVWEIPEEGSFKFGRAGTVIATDEQPSTETPADVQEPPTAAVA